MADLMLLLIAYKECFIKNLDKNRVAKALLAAVSSTEPLRSIDTYVICELIKALQNDADTNLDELFQIEWAYLPLLNSYNGALPKTLENRLATNPEFFCELIRLVYSSNKEDAP
jgi:hypothetical protein